MITFEHNRQEHKLRHNWGDMTLSEAMALRAIELPEVEDTFDWFMHIGTVREVASIMTTAPAELIPPTWLVSWHTRYWLPLWMDLRSSYPETYVPKGIKSFHHGGVEYLMPESLELGDDVVLQHGQDAKRFVEASNLLALYSRMPKEGIKVAPMFIAAVVREVDEGDFDEVRVARRAEQFVDLPMAIVWEVFFCTSELLLRHMAATLDYLQAEAATRPQTSGGGSSLWHKLGSLARWHKLGS